MAPALAEIFAAQLSVMDIEIWVEPFAGGAGAGLGLLDTDSVGEVWLTEKHPALAALWRAILNHGPELAERVARTEPDTTLFYDSRDIIDQQGHAQFDDLTLGYAALVMNRCSRSGIVAPNVGPIGGKSQAGRWTVSSRFNAAALAERITHVHSLAPRIRFTEGDAIEAIAALDGSGIEDEVLLFVDPPYIREGDRLYANGMSQEQHQALADALNASPARWLLTYDDEPVVSEELYRDRRVLAYEIANTANRARVATEYAVLSDNLWVPGAMSLLPKGGTYWVREWAGLMAGLAA